ncbi:DUF2254 family protein [Aurantiacibacter aquimixticola]|uniref:DUF2254 domain-containing protein n=1 Tax=Aurantiacibacter aquimixticola TaxID=1958945 RepID=A0A419RTT0_9SPHN|nr:DUF2254 family protein [Aurantiacibacter aquimixticola]RJY09179.1 DUF2254 domain-containing protein [Aurantiacibacter aquimixticola]
MNLLRPLDRANSWIWHKLIANYWSAPATTVALAPLLAFAILYLDRNGGTAWMIEHGLQTVSSAETARDFAAIVASINAAFLTLYFSITLIVLTMAAGTLGVRLIDRWLDKRIVKISLCTLCFSFVVALIAMLAIDPSEDLTRVPLILIGLVLLMQLIALGLLAISLHDLGRTMFVDTSIHAVGRDAKVRPAELEVRDPHKGPWAAELRADRTGYVEGLEVDRLVRKLEDHEGTIRICVAPGQHVLEGEILIQFEKEPDNIPDLQAGIPVGAIRSDNQGAVFRIRLLVEIGARALSPAINDFYTAITCADKLVDAMLGQTKNWVDAGKVGCAKQHPRFELPGQDFRSLFEDPMHAFRQAACTYPSVTIRMIQNYSRVRIYAQKHDLSGELSDFLCQLAKELRDHAISVTGFEGDRNDIEEAFNHGFEDENFRKGMAA